MPDYSDLTPNEIIKLYETQDLDTLEFTKIRKELEEGGVSEEDIMIVFRVLDKLKYKNEFRKSNKSVSREYLIVGAFVFVIGVVITIVSYAKGMGGSGNYILAYGPMIAGASIFLHGWTKR